MGKDRPMASLDLTEYLDRMDVADMGDESVITIPPYTGKDPPSRWLVQNDEATSMRMYLALSMLLVDAIEVCRRGRSDEEESGHGTIATGSSELRTPKDGVKAAMVILDKAPTLLRVKEADVLLECLLVAYAAPYLFAKIYTAVVPCLKWDEDSNDKWQLMVEASEVECPIQRRIMDNSLRDEVVRRKAYRMEMPRTNREVMRAAHTGFGAAGGMKDKLYRLLGIDDNSLLHRIQSNGTELVYEIEVVGQRVCPVYTRNMLQRVRRLLHVLDAALALRYR